MKKTFPNIQRKEIVLKSLFNKVACIQGSYFIKKRIQRPAHVLTFPLNIAKFLRTRPTTAASEVLHTHRSTISETTTAISHLTAQKN